MIPFDLDCLGAKIREIARQRSTVDVAQFQFVNLTAIQQAYGARWEAEQARVMETARTFICRRMGPDDVLVPCENGFLLLSGQDNSLDASVHAHAVAQALNRFFTGERPSSPFRVEADHQTLSIEDLPRHMTDVRSLENASVVRGAADALPADDEVRMGFLPIWDARLEAMTSYNVDPYDVATGCSIAGYRFEPEAASPARLAEVDELALRASEIALHTLARNGAKAIIGVTLHINTLVKLEQRSRLLSLLSTFDQSFFCYRKITIAGVKPGFPRLYLNETVKAFSARLPRVVVAMSAEESNFSTAIDCGAWGVGYMLPSQSTAAAGSGFWRKMRSDAAAAHARGRKFCVEGAFTTSEVQACAACGVDFMASQLVWPRLATPRRVSRLTLEDLKGQYDGRRDTIDS